jgi:hypothetical protein
MLNFRQTTRISKISSKTWFQNLKKLPVLDYLSFFTSKNKFFSPSILKLGKIQTLLHEPQFELFCQEPVYELTTVERELRQSVKDANILSEEQLLPWPEVDFLFGEDESYQTVVADIMRTVTKSLSELNEYGQTYTNFCEMIESIILLKIEKSIKKESFSPSDYHYLLQKHNEYVNILFPNFLNIYSQNS